MFVAKIEARIDPESLMGMWLLDENRDDIVLDSSGNGHDGKFVNDVKWTEGKFGKAVVLNGESHLDHERYLPWMSGWGTSLWSHGSKHRETHPTGMLPLSIRQSGLRLDRKAKPSVSEANMDISSA